MRFKDFLIQLEDTGITANGMTPPGNKIDGVRGNYAGIRSPINSGDEEKIKKPEFNPYDVFGFDEPKKNNPNPSFKFVDPAIQKKIKDMARVQAKIGNTPHN